MKRILLVLVMLVCSIGNVYGEDMPVYPTAAFDYTMYPDEMQSELWWGEYWNQLEYVSHTVSKKGDMTTVTLLDRFRKLKITFDFFCPKNEIAEMKTADYYYNYVGDFLHIQTDKAILYTDWADYWLYVEEYGLDVNY